MTDPQGFVDRDREFAELLSRLDDVESELLGAPASDDPAPTADPATPTDEAGETDEPGDSGPPARPV